MMRAYLSGGMEYASDEGRPWREELETWLNTELRWQVFNPNRESERYLSLRCPDTSFRSLKSADPVRFRAIVSEIVDLDSSEIAERSDLVICYWDASAMKGAGTKGELTVARLFKKPVYCVTTVPFEGIPGWVLGCITEMFTSFNSLKDFLRSRYPADHPDPVRMDRP